MPRAVLSARLGLVPLVDRSSSNCNDLPRGAPSCVVRFVCAGPDDTVEGWGEEWAAGGMIAPQFTLALKDTEDARAGYGSSEGPVWPGSWNCSDISGEAGQHCCSLKPCLFDVVRQP